MIRKFGGLLEDVVGESWRKQMDGDIGLGFVISESVACDKCLSRGVKNVRDFMKWGEKYK